LNLSDHYLNLYNEPALTKGYRDLTELRPPEKVIFRELKERLTDQRILDLGVGCGRTTPHFLEFTNRYTGVDYSRHMLEMCRERYPQNRFPGAKFQFCDARAMTSFPGESFDVVAFLGSGIDCVTQATFTMQ
jgi:ubiquinone/menaquinone biosynthesis C-methylase UbiE